jgi:hypothetical protein
MENDIWKIYCLCSQALIYSTFGQTGMSVPHAEAFLPVYALGSRSRHDKEDFPYIIFHFSFAIAGIHDARRTMTNEKWKMIYGKSTVFALRP